MDTFTAVRNKKQTAGIFVRVMKYVAQEKKTVWVTGGWSQVTTALHDLPIWR